MSSGKSECCFASSCLVCRVLLFTLICTRWLPTSDRRSNIGFGFAPELPYVAASGWVFASEADARAMVAGLLAIPPFHTDFRTMPFINRFLDGGEECAMSVFGLSDLNVHALAEFCKDMQSCLTSSRFPPVQNGAARVSFR